MRWNWSSAADKAFKSSKTALKNANFLAHFDPSKPLRVECDASPYGIGAVLPIKVGNEYRPIGFRSRTLSVAERNYAHLKRETLAPGFGVTKFRQYLLGRHFTLVTDHKPLSGLFRPDRPIQSMAAARIQRWSLILRTFSYDLVFLKGTENLNAVALSRLPCPVEEDSSTEELPEYVLLMEQLAKNFVPTADLQQLTTEDNDLRPVQIWIQSGSWASNNPNGEVTLRPYL